RAGARRLGRRVPDRRARAAPAAPTAAFRFPPALREQGAVLRDHVADSVHGHPSSLPRPARCRRLRGGHATGCLRSNRMNAAVSDRITLIRHANEAEWIEDVAKEMETILTQEVQQRGRARMLLSGGTTPAPIYELLAEQPLEWARIEVGLADERWLSPQDRDSNAWLVRNSFMNLAEGAHFDPLVRVGLPIAECVHSANLLAAHSQPACLVVLGMGNDGHTASLFPGSRDLERALQSNQTYASLDASGCPVAKDWHL